MKAPADRRFTRREMDVMSILWRRGSGTVAEVRSEMPDPPGYTSVLWLLQRLTEKKAVRFEVEGRAHRYFPEVDQEAAGTSVISRVVDKIFHGSSEMLVARLVAEGDLSDEELRRLRTLIDRRLERGTEGLIAGQEVSDES